MMSAASIKDEQRVAYHVNLKEGTFDAPEQPEPLSILRELRRFNASWWPGGYADQPYLLLMELNCVIECELEDENVRYVNALYNAPPPKPE